MQRMIIVSGVGNTGKTTAIIKAMNMCGIQVVKRGDVCVVAPILGKRDFIVGFCSGGDHVSIVDRNLNFLETSEARIAVLACKSIGNTITRLKSYCSTKGIAHQLIKTHSVNFRNWQTSATKTATEIYQAIYS